jgi:hypothetical protein
LFDANGATLLQTSGVHYLELGTHSKLSQLGGSSGIGGGSGSYTAPGGGGGSSILGAPAPASGDSVVIGNLAPEVPLGAIDPLLSFTPVSIPEPAALLLLAPGFALALRLRARARRRSPGA